MVPVLREEERPRDEPLPKLNEDSRLALFSVPKDAVVSSLSGVVLKVDQLSALIQAGRDRTTTDFVHICPMVMGASSKTSATGVLCSMPVSVALTQQLRSLSIGNGPWTSTRRLSEREMGCSRITHFDVSRFDL